ncbi:MAG TPA: response regulator [Candidatus Angelobacter sp.]
MPVRRPNHKNRSIVVAITEELDEWIKTDPTTKPPALPAGNANVTSGPFKRRVLIVDDDEALLVTTAAILIKQGYDVRTARDGFEALATMRIGLPDILVSDLRLPNMSGFELLAVVRRRFPAMGVIAISGEFTPATRPAILADHFVDKGVNSAFELTEAVRELFSQIPLRSQPAKADPAPAWIPRSTNGYVVLTCLDCLRSFSVALKLLHIDEVAHETCVHCGQDVHYRIDQTVLPVAAELPTLLDRARSSLEKCQTMITNTKHLIRSSRYPGELESRRAEVNRDKKFEVSSDKNSAPRRKKIAAR